MAEHFGVAKEDDVTSQEIEAVQAIAMAVLGGRVRAQLADARRRVGREP